jgi:5'-3' exonuclease
MGVNRLWHLLQASGRALELRQLSGSIVAIDVSIWMVRIIHGMAKAGVQNFSRGHLIGILTRIMYLLDNDIKPIFVFDGPAPVLK